MLTCSHTHTHTHTHTHRHTDTQTHENYSNTYILFTCFYINYVCLNCALVHSSPPSIRAVVPFRRAKCTGDPFRTFPSLPGWWRGVMDGCDCWGHVEVRRGHQGGGSRGMLLCAKGVNKKAQWPCRVLEGVQGRKALRACVCACVCVCGAELLPVALGWVKLNHVRESQRDTTVPKTFSCSFMKYI